MSGVIARFEIHEQYIDRDLKAVIHPDYDGGFSTGKKFVFIELFPDRSLGNAPTGTPKRVANIYDQATSNLANQNWDASGAMSRKCLDVATKMLARERLSVDESKKISEAWLKNRIGLLHQAGLITSDIAELAMVIKDGGDGASHDEEPYSQEDATALLEFSKVFLTYVFTIPHMVRSVKVDDENKTEAGKA